jgi:hypothetical protein
MAAALADLVHERGLEPALYVFGVIAARPSIHANQFGVEASQPCEVG